jgi:SAM-dependent methyltransferase
MKYLRHRLRVASLRRQGDQMHHHKLFSDKSDLYAHARPEYPQEVFTYLASICPSTHLAWDSACGNGQAAMGLIKEFDRVYASDVSKEQISNAKAHSRIRYEAVRSENTLLESDSCDLICVAQALHWFDYDLFWPEARRILKPGGIFTAIGYNWASVNEEIDLEVDKHVFDIIKPYWATQNQLIWDHYRDLQIPFAKLDTPKFVMEVNWSLKELFGFMHTFSATRRCMDAIGGQFFEDAYAIVAEFWGEPNIKRPVEFDFVFYVGKNET